MSSFETDEEKGSEAAASGAPRSLEWSVYPLLAYPVRSIFAVILVLLSGVLVGVAAGYWFVGVLGAAILVLSLYNHFFPSYYRLDGSGAEVRVLFAKRRRGWDYFRSYYADKMGVMLSTFTYASRLDSFRGMNLRFAKENRDDVIDFVEYYLPLADRKKRK
ncbi:MAG: hypothetical protein JSW52_08205 [Candidatus Coatesbacteria bacterium]|nr:MAG: hypothetical protein JSW52_08205 [Candidatus Coatesbacteria bacterium]